MDCIQQRLIVYIRLEKHELSVLSIATGVGGRSNKTSEKERFSKFVHSLSETASETAQATLWSAGYRYLSRSASARLQEARLPHHSVDGSMKLTDVLFYRANGLI
jgi:hypothetical protein